MSKYLKQLIVDEYKRRLDGVKDAVLVNVIGLDANTSNRLRAELREKGIKLMVVKNSLAARATADTPLAPLFDGVTGPSAICWGGEDVVTLVKEVMRLVKDEQYPAFQAKAGVMDGKHLSVEQLEEVSKWPSRDEMLAMLVSQMMGPANTLAGQILGPARTLAGQVDQLIKKAEEGGAEGQKSE